MQCLCSRGSNGAIEKDPPVGLIVCDKKLQESFYIKGFLMEGNWEAGFVETVRTSVQLPGQVVLS